MAIYHPKQIERVSGKHTLHVDDEAANELAPFVDCLPKFSSHQEPKVHLPTRVSYDETGDGAASSAMHKM